MRRRCKADHWRGSLSGAASSVATALKECRLSAEGELLFEVRGGQVQAPLGVVKNLCMVVWRGWCGEGGVMLVLKWASRTGSARAVSAHRVVSLSFTGALQVGRVAWSRWRKGVEDGSVLLVAFGKWTDWTCVACGGASWRRGRKGCWAC